MIDKHHRLHEHLDGVITEAVVRSLHDASLADVVTKAVLAAIDEYEDQLFSKILDDTQDSQRVSIESIRDTLKS